MLPDYLLYYSLKSFPKKCTKIRSTLKTLCEQSVGRKLPKKTQKKPADYMWYWLHLSVYVPSNTFNSLEPTDLFLHFQTQSMYAPPAKQKPTSTSEWKTLNHSNNI